MGVWLLCQILSKEFWASLYGQKVVFLLSCFIDIDEKIPQLLTFSTASKKTSDFKRYLEKENSA